MVGWRKGGKGSPHSFLFTVKKIGEKSPRGQFGQHPQMTELSITEAEYTCSTEKGGGMYVYSVWVLAKLAAARISISRILSPAERYFK
jgi:hypothetical protein